jgi:hypothetical protein
MRSLLNRTRDECERLQNLLETSAAEGLLGGGIEALLESLPADGRAHFADCRSCREIAQELLATRELLLGALAPTEDGGPWFVKRVLSAIAAREREMAFPASAWSMVPRFASRLAWATAVVLLAGSTWLYRGATPSAPRQPAAASSQEYLFEAPAPQMNQDDVLISMAERNP